MRKILLVFFLAGFAATAQAQLGLRAGFNSANFSDADFSANSGFHLGAYYTFGTDFVSVEPGIQYSQKGYFGTQNGTGLEIEERLGYVDVPLLVRFRLLPAINVFAGPQGSILTSSIYQIGKQASDSYGAIKVYDIAGVVGAQVKLPLGFNVQASYELGVTSLNYYNTDVKNQVLKISAGYTF